MAIGRLTKDPELRYTPNGAAVVNFTIACDRPKDGNGNHETDFLDCVIWNKAAENLAQYMSKGRKVFVEGPLRNKSSEGKDGTKYHKSEIQVSYCEYLDNSNNQQKNTAQSQNQFQGQQSQNQFQEQASQNQFQGQQPQNQFQGQQPQNQFQGQAPQNQFQGQQPQNQFQSQSQQQRQPQPQYGNNQPPYQQQRPDVGMEIKFTEDDLPFYS